MQSEYDLIKNGTRELVTPSKYGKIIGNKWVLRIKLKAERSLDKYK